MNREVLIAKVCNKLNGCTRDEIKVILDAVIESIKECIIEFGEMKIRGLGSFVVKEQKERIGTHPKTGETITIPASKTVKFKCSKTFKNEVNH